MDVDELRVAVKAILKIMVVRRVERRCVDELRRLTRLERETDLSFIL